eukprot:13514194-Alexandrium_andersonii.AAC.1
MPNLHIPRHAHERKEQQGEPSTTYHFDGGPAHDTYSSSPVEAATRFSGRPLAQTGRCAHARAAGTH